jgi:CheY-like chemotaxis protein
MNKFLTTIAVIDDDEVFQMLIKKVLQNHDVADTISQFSNGLTALSYFQACADKVHQLPMVVLLDISMPEMDGWEFLKHFKEISFAHAYEPIIFIVTGSENIDYEKLRDYPMVKGYLKKPFVSNEFIRLIQEAIDNRR